MIPVMDVALSPIQLPTFVAMRRLRERACVISSGLIEVGQPGYDASLARLDSTAKDALVTRRRVETGAVVPSDPSEPVLTPAEVRLTLRSPPLFPV